MSTPTTIDEATARLVAARRSGRPAAAPELADAEAAYAVQDGVARALGWWGDAAAPQHWKSGGASRSAPQTHARLPPAGGRRAWVCGALREAPPDFQCCGAAASPHQPSARATPSCTA